MKVLLVILCVVGSMTGAIYKGKSLDGKKLEAVVRSKDVVSDARVIFNEKSVDIYLRDKIITAKMSAEVIENIHEIEATDGKDTWIINLSDLD